MRLSAATSWPIWKRTKQLSHWKRQKTASCWQLPRKLVRPYILATCSQSSGAKANPGLPPRQPLRKNFLTFLLLKQTFSNPPKNRACPTNTRFHRSLGRKAKELGVNLAAVQPADGRKISGADVEAYAERPADAVNGRGQRRIELGAVKRLTGQRMLESARNVPQFALTIDADIRKLLTARAIARQSGQNFSMTALLVFLTAKALLEHPLLNARFENDGVTVFGAAHIGVATAAEDGLRVPVIHDADQLGLAAINDKLADLAGRARKNRLSLREISDGTFTISNLGMTGISQFTPLVNPPQSAILGVAAPRDIFLPGAEGGMYRAQLLALTVACDHRVLDGADAAAFLATLKAGIESFQLER